MKKLFILSILVISAISSSFGQDVNIRSAFDSSRIYIGDQIRFTITVDKPSGLKLTIPVLKDTLCKNIEIVSGPRTDSSQTKDGRTRIIQKYLITSFDSGRYQIKPFFAETKNAGGIKRFYSDYSLLEVLRVKIAPQDTTAKIFDIIPPYKAPVTIGEILPWALILIFAGIIVWAVLRYLPKLKKTEPGIEDYIPRDPAHVIAFRELEKLRDEKLWQSGEVKKYYTRLTEILRQYLENRYKVYSLELTTSETLDALVKTGFKKDGAYSELKTVLNAADLVKFAKYNPLPSENESHFQSSWNFILTTKEAEIVAEQVELKIGEQEAII
jgi:hypothetical protein